MATIISNFVDLVKTLPPLDDFPETSRDCAHRPVDIKLNYDLVQIFETYFIATMEEVERHKQIAHEADQMRAAQERQALEERQKRADEARDKELGKNADQIAPAADPSTEGAGDAPAAEPQEPDDSQAEDSQGTDGEGVPKDPEKTPKKKRGRKKRGDTPKKPTKPVAPKPDPFKNPILILDAQQKMVLGQFVVENLPVEFVYSVMKLLGDTVVEVRRERETRLAKIKEREEKRKAKAREKKEQEKMLMENLGVDEEALDAGDKAQVERDVALDLAAGAAAQGDAGDAGNPAIPPRIPQGAQVDAGQPQQLNVSVEDGKEMIEVIPQAPPVDKNAAPPPEAGIITPALPELHSPLDTTGGSSGLPTADTTRDSLNSSGAGADADNETDSPKKQPRQLVNTADVAAVKQQASEPDTAAPAAESSTAQKAKKEEKMLHQLDDEQLLEEMMALDDGPKPSKRSRRMRSKPVRYNDPDSEESWGFSDEDSVDEYATTADEDEDDQEGAAKKLVNRMLKIENNRKRKKPKKKEHPAANEREDLNIKLRWNVQPQDFVHGFAISVQASRRSHRITWLGDPDYDPTQYQEKEDPYGNLIMIRRKKPVKSKEKGHPANPQNVYRCQICHKNFRTSKKMKIHVEATHQGVKRFRCNYNGCEFRSAWSKCMKNHIVRVHNLDRIYKCNFEGCPRAFKDKKSLRQHIRLHTGDKPYKCPYCEYAGSQKTCLNYHLKKHHNVVKQPRNLNVQSGYDTIEARKSARAREEETTRTAAHQATQYANSAHVANSQQQQSQQATVSHQAQPSQGYQKQKYTPPVPPRNQPPIQTNAAGLPLLPTAQGPSSQQYGQLERGGQLDRQGTSQLGGQLGGQQLGPVPPYRTQAQKKAEQDQVRQQHQISITGNMPMPPPPPMPRSSKGLKAPKKRMGSQHRQTVQHSLGKNILNQQAAAQHTYQSNLPTMDTGINENPYYTFNPATTHSITTTHRPGQQEQHTYMDSSNVANLVQSALQLTSNAQQINQQIGHDESLPRQNPTVHMCYCPCHIYNDKTKCKCFCP